MLKKGGWLKATEEGLEDQDLFQQWLPAAAARSMALAENTVLEALLATIDGVEIAVAHTPTDAEIVAGYYALAQEYRDGAVFLMNDLTLAYLRSMLVATPRAYGEFGFQPMSMGELGETFLNKRVFTNANWDPVTTAADDVKIIDFVNLDECLWWVERRGISIFVDPYTERASAGTIQFLISARFNGAIVNSAALSGVDDHA
jgi:HK97 family phage major capsid protein